MISLTHDTINNVVVTLSENTTLNSTAFYLFEFISDNTLKPTYFTAEDISDNICRYNQFNIQLVSSTSGLINTLIGIINLEINGYYKYRIYQQESPTNLNPLSTGSLVENGKVYVLGDPLKPITTSYDSNDDNEFIAYQ